MNHENEKPLRPELSALIERLSLGQDENRPEAVARRRQKHLRTARANVTDLCDDGSFIEYGALAVAAQRGRRSEADLIQKTPTDGMIAGVGDIVVDDDTDAVAVARKYLSYFQGKTSQWRVGDQTLLRDLIPENSRQAYNVRTVISAMADTDSFLELRPKFGAGIVTGLMCVEGQPFGVIANNCMHMAGAIEAEAADKAARMMQLCQAHGLPILSLCDTPGFMVGPDMEKRAQVRHVSRMFVVGSHLTVPFFTLVLRRGYGLGVMAMSRGGFHDAFFTAAWPTAEFGAMGIDGAIKAGFKRELAAIEDEAQRKELYDHLVAELYKRGQAMNMASYLEIDAVIDPADTRCWITRGIKSAPPEAFGGKGHGFVDSW